MALYESCVIAAHELDSESFSHARLGSRPGWQAEREIWGAGAAGLHAKHTGM